MYVKCQAQCGCTSFWNGNCQKGCMAWGTNNGVCSGNSDVSQILNVL